ncbi:MAG: hypothetical protein SGJ07_10165 [Rhodospirillaceae bacterium]|nr:hypothetical protein [Rhodospirillaceae bacterium]
MRLLLCTVPVVLLFASTSMRRAQAHAFGQRYDLPLPLDLYLAAAGTAVAVSFLIVALFSARFGARTFRTRLVLWQRPDESASWRLLGHVLRAVGVAIFFLIVAAGLVGAASPVKNIAPLLVWVLWWVGFLLFTALIGNLWPALDPWASLRNLALPKRDGSPLLAWPAWLGGWPAVLLFLAFGWAELVGPFGESPSDLALLVLAYSVFAWGGMMLFGDAAWRNNADPFRRVFGLIGASSLFGRTKREADRPLVLRLPGSGLLEAETGRISDVVFVMAVLATVTFDGFSETPLWAAFLDWIARSQMLRPVLLGISSAGIEILDAIRTTALIVAPLVVVAIYTLFCALTSLADRAVTLGMVMRAFAVSLLPIAIAYHLSHYISYLLLAGQFAIPMASDPFGFGWDLFGTSGYVMDIGIIGARQVWYVAVAALVTGHIISVIVAHSIALRLFPNARAATLSQLPFLVLMVGFTACSLWILAQPVVNEPALSSTP